MGDIIFSISKLVKKIQESAKLMTENDEIVWTAINHYNCCFKIKTKTQDLCRNTYNLTGLCNRSSCPLANSQYATIKEEEGYCYLWIKTIERTHMPNKLWKKIRLDTDYLKALNQIDEYLEFWPKFLVHKSKQRLTKTMQYISRIQKLGKNIRPKTMTISKKHKKRELKRELKSEIAAHLENTIKRNIISRLNSGEYRDIYSLPYTQEIIASVEDYNIEQQNIHVNNEGTYFEELNELEANLEYLDENYEKTRLIKEDIETRYKN